MTVSRGPGRVPPGTTATYRDLARPAKISVVPGSPASAAASIALRTALSWHTDRLGRPGGSSIRKDPPDTRQTGAMDERLCSAESTDAKLGDAPCLCVGRSIDLTAETVQHLVDRDETWSLEMPVCLLGQQC